MKETYLKGLILIHILFLAACSGTKKFNHTKAYKFSYYNYQKQINEGPSDGEIHASSEPVIPYTNPNHRIPEPGAASSIPPTKTEKAALKQTKKQIKRRMAEIDLEIEELKTAGKTVLGKVDNYQNTIKKLEREKKELRQMNRKIYIGILVGAAGLVLLIISTAEVLGTLALVAGLGLIVWGFIEKGGF